MKPWRLVRSAVWTCAQAAGLLGLWSLWLLLGALLATQIYVASTESLPVPPPLLRRIESGLAQNGLSVSFGRTRFDPSGRLLIEDAALTLPSFGEPVATARALYVRLDPWALMVGRIELLEIKATGVDLLVPSMLSPSGQAEKLVQGLDLAVRPLGRDLVIDYASFRAGDLAVTARGAVRPAGFYGPPTLQGGSAGQRLARDYGSLSRRAAAGLLSLRALEGPSLRLVLSPSDTAGAVAHATLTARSVTLGGPAPLRAEELWVDARAPLAGPAAPARCEARAERLRLPAGLTAPAASLLVEGTLDPGRPSFTPASVRAAAPSLSAEGFTLEDPVVGVAGSLPRVEADAQVRVMGVPLELAGWADFGARSAEARFAGGLAPGLLDSIGARAGRNLRELVDFSRPVRVHGQASFGPGWAFQRAAAAVEAEGVTAYHVRLDEARGRVEFDGRRLRAPEAFARIGQDYARGSYENDLSTHVYRFLLDGRLRPLDITAWFPRAPWWKEFFGRFQFPAAPPSASVDVRGRTDSGRAATTFAFVDSAKPVLEGAHLDRLLTRVFARQNFDDALEIRVAAGAGSASGTFTRRADLDTGNWTSLDLNLNSSLSLAEIGRIPEIADTLEPFAFDQPPAVELRGHWESASAPRGAHTELQIDASTGAPWRFHRFPLDRGAAHVSIRDDELRLERLDLGFAGGRATGGARIWGRDAQRRISFQGSLKDASLGRATAVVAALSAKPGAGPRPALGKYVADKASVRSDASATAAGPYADLTRLQGDGTAALRGENLLQVQLLGALSGLLKFTALRFNAADAKFRIADGQLLFSTISVTGANSAIQASGTYRLEKHLLDFNAKIYPFQQSTSIPQRLLNLALSPVTSVLEARLTGSIDNPDWSLGLGLPNLLRPGSAPPPPSPLRPPSG